jgi:nicotinate-nucleotide--dimethylbenzimidazole phosphoribosyltransferase
MATTDPRLTTLAARITPLDASTMQLAKLRQDQLTKPTGSLGRLEELAIQVAGITGSAVPPLPRDKAVIVMAADHGVAEESVSAYPQAVTAQMVMNFLRGGAGINVLARAAGARVVVVDVGVASELPPHPELRICRLGPGTRNFAHAAAMSRTQAEAAIDMGASILEREVERGLDLVATGDMGIANTTAASAVVAALTGSPPAEVVGRGTGIDDATYARKVRVIEAALALHQPDPADALDVLAKVGGFEIGGLAGVIIAAAAQRMPIVLDGLISGAAALLAASLAPACRPYLIAAHRSVEIGHRVVLDRLGLRPLLDLDLRLGEGTGATLAMPIIDAALRIHREMATFAEAQVSNRESPDSLVAEQVPSSVQPSGPE